MILFLLGLFLLLGGYMVYGKIMARVVRTKETSLTPAIALADGVDYVRLPKWKNMLIQLLNIAGIGPVIGVIMGIKFGAIVFVLIPIGNIIAGAVHDFAIGVMSMRHSGANLPTLLMLTTNRKIYTAFSIFLTLTLLLVVAVFINIPANLCNGLYPNGSIFWLAAIAIFIYYIIATIFPIDKIIGRFYPIFGIMLLVGSLLLFIMLIIEAVKEPMLLTETVDFKANMFTPEKNQPIIPLLFVTIACGILSGFHATQSTIIARTIGDEKEAKATFYGMMVIEGVIAMIWAGAAMAIFNRHPELMIKTPIVTLQRITTEFLGSSVGVITVLSVIILAVTSGDTALRSVRISCAEIFGISQKRVKDRIILLGPFIVALILLLWWSNKDAKSFGILWNYFAWANQVVAAATFAVVTIWFIATKKMWFVVMIPGLFITFIIFTFILWTSPQHGGPYGLGLPLNYAELIAAFLTFVVGVYTYMQGITKRGSLNN